MVVVVPCSPRASGWRVMRPVVLGGGVRGSQCSYYQADHHHHHRELLSCVSTNGGVWWGSRGHWWSVVECIDLCSGGSQVSGLYTPSAGEQSDGE